jgi:uncharacterized protein YndB with AHSA1/START domain
MERVDTASRVIPAERARVFEALIDPDALASWLPPEGMTGRFERFDPRPGGGYRMVLRYDDASASPGKTTAGEDVAEARFAEIVPDERIVQEVDFVSDDPAFSGTMRMTWQVSDDESGTLVTIRAEHVPPGISPADHAAGLASSLANLATHLTG